MWRIPDSDTLSAPCRLMVLGGFRHDTERTDEGRRHPGGLQQIPVR